MLRISSLSPEEIRERIEGSNRASYNSQAQYVCWENRALHSDYDFICCPCESECWCKRRGCLGHYRIKEISFDRFLETYVTLWIPPRARNSIKRRRPRWWTIQGAPKERDPGAGVAPAQLVLRSCQSQRLQQVWPV